MRVGTQQQVGRDVKGSLQAELSPRHCTCTARTCTAGNALVVFYCWGESTIGEKSKRQGHVKNKERIGRVRMLFHLRINLAFASKSRLNNNTLALGGLRKRRGSV